MEKELSRRSFLAGMGAAGLAVAGAGLTACSGSTGSETQEKASNTLVSTDASSTSGGMTAKEYFSKWSFEIPPEPITDIAETIEAEVVVVGAGTAGLVTANSAADAGADTILISASSIPIGRGGSNHAVYSKAKERLNCPKDPAVDYEKEIRVNGSLVDARKWYKYYNNSEEAMNWLIDIMEDAGYETVIEAQMSIIEDGAIYNAVGAHGWVDQDNPVGPMNQPLVVKTLATRLEEKTSHPIYYKNIGRQLVRGDQPNGTEGRVTAIIAEREDGTYAKYVGTKAVVLATGDFSLNRDMMAKYSPDTYHFIDEALFDEKPNYDKEFVFGGLYYGDGQKMGLWVGAAWQRGWTCGYNGGGAKACPPVNNGMLMPAVNVTRDGVRFCNEYTNLGNGPFEKYISTPGHTVYAIWDTGLASKFPLPWLGDAPRWTATSTGEPRLTPEQVIAGWDGFVENGLFHKADTLEDLIKDLGLPDTTLETIKNYNAMCAAGEDTEFHKSPELMIPVEEGPFYGSVDSTNPFLTVLGGLRTNDLMQVCNEDDEPIPGLYNVGSMAGDMFHSGYTAMIPGLTLGSFIAHGYVTGKYIAENE